MILQSQYYEEKLYPLQDGVMNTIKKCGTRFFLTGGTALSRAYYRHRYSDDLDFFVNDDNEFIEQLKTIFSELKKDGFSIDTVNDFISTQTYVSCKIGWGKTDAVLKLDFVNDVACRFGDIVKTELFDRTDSIRNMLSNKLTALVRYASKDIADIREIALNEKVDWKQAMREAQQKVIGIDVTSVCDILMGIPESEFERIVWTKKPSWEEFRKDIDKIVADITNGANSG